MTAAEWWIAALGYFILMFITLFFGLYPIAFFLGVLWLFSFIGFAIALFRGGSK